MEDKNVNYAVKHDGFYNLEFYSMTSESHDIQISINNGIKITAQYCTYMYQRCFANVPLKKGTQLTFSGAIGDAVAINYGTGNV